MSDFEEVTEVKENAGLNNEAEAAENELMSFSEDEVSDADDTEIDYIDQKKQKRKKKLIIAGCIAGAAVLAAVGFGVRGIILKRANQADMYTDAQVERRTISNTITGSSYVEPNDSYNVISMHSGDITSDYINEGATVKKGDKLYQFDDEDARNQLTSAQNNLTKAQQQYADAVKSKAQTVSSNNAQTQSARNSVERALNTLNDARDALHDRYVISDITGKVSAVYVDNGDDVQNGMQLAEVYNDAVMTLRLPFNEFDAENLYEGAAAEVSIAGSGETVWGTVTEVASASTASKAHTMVTYATIELANPGALTTDDIGSAVVNGAACADTANFEYIESKTITASASGTLQSLNIEIGDSVYVGEQIAYIDSNQLETSYDNARLSYDDALLSLERQVLNNDTYSQDSNIKNAQLSLEDARLQLKNAQDNVADYVIEAPIDGTVVTKNAKAGDTIDSSNGSEALCVIYDLSCVKFSIDVDETEIALVKTGQKVSITADAVEGEFEGEVIKVPVDGVNQNGVTTYKIDIQIDDYGDLLPGMNIDAEIVVEEADNVLAIPVNSVNRGNIVFIKDDGTPHENDVTDMLGKELPEDGELPDGMMAGMSGEESVDNGSKPDERPQGSGAPESGASGERPQGNPPEGMPEGERPDNGSMPGERPQGGGAAAPDGSAAPGQSAAPGVSSASGRSSGIADLMANLPRNIEVPDGYRAIVVETGINDTSYIEIKSGLNEGDMVRTLNTQASSAGASFGQEGMMSGMGMGGMGMGGGMPGGGMGGGMPGGGGGGNRGGMGGGPGGMR